LSGHYDDEMVKARLKAMGKWAVPGGLPDKGGYTIDVKLRGPPGIFSDGKELAIQGYVGLGPDVLELYRRIWHLLETAKADRLAKWDKERDDKERDTKT
jgi:hypothetical protein